MKYELKYRTFDELLVDVQTDFRTFNLENMIEPQELIRVARKVSRDLGLRIYMTAQKVLDVEHNKAKLPDNFHVLNFAMLCGTYIIHTPVIQGTQVHEIPCQPTYQPAPPPLPPNQQCPPPVDPCAPPPPPCGSLKPTCCINKCGDGFELVQVIKTETRIFRHLMPLKFRKSGFIDCDCPNITWSCRDEAWISDGWIHTNFKTGKVYINYQSTLEDEDGNLLVLDHEIVNEYYEYALKERILENLWMRGEDVVQKLQYTQQKLRAARNNAFSLVRTPDFEEMRKTWEINRKAQHSKYYDMFSSYGRLMYRR